MSPPARPGVGAGGRVALIERRGKFLVAEPFFERGPRLAVSRGERASVGDLVLVRPGVGRGGRGGGRATVGRRIGRPSVARDVIEALMLDRGLRREFDPAVTHEARDAAAGMGESDAARRDLRSLPTFTIDPAGARDFDDAISAVAREHGAWTVWVHIADVCAFVRPRSLLDREAYRRGTSVYAPGAVEPMLPPALSNGACSLVPGQDRLAVTIELTVAGDAVQRAAFYRSLIRSDARLDYDRVDRVFAGREAAPEPGSAALAAARGAAGALAARRVARGALALESSEPDFELDRDGNVIGARSVAQTESHRLIEHLMIAANEQVARLLEEHRTPALFRVHERPDAPAVQRLIDQLASLGVPTPPVAEHMTAQQAADAVGEASQLVRRHIAATGGGRRGLTSLVLRALKQAYYDPRNRGHAGLQSARYCHFTSPIRRYPDLVCHRALLSVVSGTETAPEASWVATAGTWASARERESMTIERDADDVALCFLLERVLVSLGREAVFEGEIIGLIRSGAFVAFSPTEGGVGGSLGPSFQGMLPVRRLRGDWWELNEQGTALIGTRDGGAIRLGDPVRVQVGGIDPPRGRVDLLPVGR